MVDSESHQGQSSDEALAIVRKGLEARGFRVESGKAAANKIQVPVLFGPNGNVEKSFEADAYNPTSRVVVEVEAGRGVANNQFLKDLFQACMMNDVSYLAIAVRNTYTSGTTKRSVSRDFDRVVTWFDTLYASGRITLPLAGVLIVGY